LSNRDGAFVLELYLGDPPVDTYYNDDDGLYMSIHNQSEVPFSRNPVIKIAAGTSNSIIIKKSFTQKLQPPAGSCMSDGFSSDLYDFMNKTLKVNYTQEYCFSLCITKLFQSSCNSTNLDYPPISLNSTLRACTIFSDNVCARKTFASLTQANVTDYCNSKCPNECLQIDYETNSFQKRYPSDFYIPYLYNKTQTKGFKVNLTNIYKTFSKIEISVGSMFYKITTQTKQYQLSDLIGLIGIIYNTIPY